MPLVTENVKELANEGLVPSAPSSHFEFGLIPDQPGRESFFMPA